MTTPSSISRLSSRLQELARDLRWTWSHEADHLWRRIDEPAWERSHNPWTLLRGLQSKRLEALAAEPDFVPELNRLADARDAYLAGPTWFDSTRGASVLKGVAYFSMEFGVGEALPLYAGGLGVLAGDYLKTASDLGVPLTGVGLFYSGGYFRQVIDAEGRQHETYPANDPGSLPIVPASTADGTPLEVRLSLPGRTLALRVWQARVGRCRLYLLDANVPQNNAADRGITARLYADGAEIRLLQELVLGIAGWRVIEALGLAIDICHLNEGHAAFVVIERARRFRLRTGVSFWEALWATRAGNLFTTHTPIAAGFDRWAPALLATYERYLDNIREELGVSARELLALGRADPADDNEPFNMAYLAMRGSAHTIAVSRQHEAVSRRIFGPLFRRWPESEIPIGHITNGIHVPSWDSTEADRLWTAACGKDRWRSVSPSLAGNAMTLTDEQLWLLRNDGRRVLVSAARARFARKVASLGQPAARIGEAEQVLDSNILTLGFARRFTDYKRPNLLLHDADRFERLLSDQIRPVQLVVAGKAHPADAAGKRMIEAWIAFAQRPRVARRVVFLEDYDLVLAQELVQGVDVWINTPRRPWEACGTSGMKILVNGGLNLSVRDGWWEEAFAADLGWAIGDDAASDPDPDEMDRRDALQLLDVLEKQIVPEFYRRDTSGVPRDWLNRIRRSLSQLTPAYSSNRMLQEHLDQIYLSAAAEFGRRTKDGARVAQEIFAWERRLRDGWKLLHVGDSVAITEEATWKISAPVYLGDIRPDDVRLELFADADERGSAFTTVMTKAAAIPGVANGFIYTAGAPLGRPAQHYAVRLVPDRAGVAVPAELNLVFWQK